MEKTLKKLGFSDKDVSVYMTLLKSGTASVRELAKETGINRGSVYDILKKLTKQGLVIYFDKDKVRRFVADDPKKIKDLLSEKQEQLRELKDEVKEVVPQLRSIYEDLGEKPRVEMYEGQSGIKKIFEDILSSLRSGEEYLVFSSVGVKDKLYQKFPDFTDKRIKKGIKVRVLSMGEGGELRGLDERRWISKGSETGLNYIIIYLDKLAIISVDEKGELMCVIIKNKGIATTQAKIFNNLWNKS